MKKKLIGKTDRADFPKLGLEDIAVKIDTGAYTSSIHCSDIKEENNILSCLFLDAEHTTYNNKRFSFKKYNQVTVRSSNGVQQKRYAIKSTLTLFGKKYKISLSLNDRSDMRYPVLLGRKFLNGKFIVDPQLKNLSFNQKK